MYTTAHTQVFKDGDWIRCQDLEVDFYSQSLHYGNAAFEGIRSYEIEDGFSVFKSREHFERLVFSAEKMYLNLRYSVPEMMKIAEELLIRNHLRDAYIRPLVVAGSAMSLEPSSECSLYMAAWQWPKLFQDGLRLMTSSFERPNPKSTHIEAKLSGHYVNSILATKEAKNNGFDEALLLDQEGWIAEGPGANFFFEKNGELFTPDLGNILNGITRQTIIDLATENGYKVNVGKFSREDVLNADGAFFTGTAAEVTHIQSLDDKEFAFPWEKTIGFELSKLYQQLTRNPLVESN